MSARRQVERDREAGFSLAETTVAMALSVFVLLIAGAIFLPALKSSNDQSVNNAGGDAMQIATERLSRDVRGATAVLSTSSSSQLVLWLDANGDGLQQSAEVVTWALGSNGACRTAGSSTSCSGRGITAMQFTYDTSNVVVAHSVTVTLTYGTASTVTPTHTQSWTVERRSST